MDFGSCSWDWGMSCNQCMDTEEQNLADLGKPKVIHRRSCKGFGGPKPYVIQGPTVFTMEYYSAVKR